MTDTSYTKYRRRSSKKIVTVRLEEDTLKLLETELIRLQNQDPSWNRSQLIDAIIYEKLSFML